MFLLYQRLLSVTVSCHKHFFKEFFFRYKNKYTHTSDVLGSKSTGLSWTPALKGLEILLSIEVKKS